ncbi:hypothetical protein ACJ41O_003777 [Fusarium nematophilum]
MLSPSPSSPGGEPPITGTFWPPIRDTLLLDPVSFHRLSLECAICLEPMTVLPDQHRDDPGMPGFDHSARILPCGHIFGTKCILTALRQDFPLGTCPTCRRALQHSRCGHPISGIPMPHRAEDVDRLPPVMGEAGAEVAEDCSECKVSEVIMGLDTLIKSLTTLDRRQDRIAISARAGNMIWHTFPPQRQEVLNLRDMDPRGARQHICDIAAALLAWEDEKRWRSDNLRGIQIRPHLYETRAVRSP